jgi:arylsulfatase A-like enzyme
VSAALLAACLLASPAAAERPRGIVLIVVDALAAGHLGAYGYARPTSPRIDALAKEGALFEDAVSASHWTLPALSSLMTGLLPSAHGALLPPQGDGWPQLLEAGRLRPGPGERLEPSRPALASLLGAGYRSLGVVSGGFCRSAFGFGQGFSEYRDTGDRAAELERHWSPWLGKNRNAPFFLYIHLGDVHEPYRAPEPWRSRWTARGYKGPVDGSRESLQALAIALAEGHASREDLEQARALYDAGVAYDDHQIGRVIDRLKALGRYQDTAVIVTADHGEAFGEHGRLRHANSFHEEVLRVPLVMRLPAEAAGLRLSGVARSIDVLPTLLDWLGMPLPRMSGRSLLPRLRGAPAQPLEALAEADDGFALRGLDGWKLIRHRGHDALYDLNGDPAERKDLSAERPEKAAALLARAEALRAEAAALGRSLGPAPAPRPALRDELKAAGYSD